MAIGKAYSFLPSGVTFNKAIRFIYTYVIPDLPENVESVVLAYYTSETGWQYLEPESGVVAEVGKLTVPINHFSVFAVLAIVSPPASAPPPPPALVKPTPPPLAPQPLPKRPAAFNIGNLSITPSLDRVWDKLTFVARTGKEAVIMVEVQNYGELAGYYTAVLTINGIEYEEKNIYLNPGQTGSISFQVITDKTGNYMIELGGLRGEFKNLLWINWWLIAGLTSALIVISLLIWYYRKRKRQKGSVAESQLFQ